MTESVNYRISEPAEVERIVRRFMAMTLREIKQYQTAAAPTADCFTDAIIEIEVLDKNKAQYMDFMDIFCLVRENISSRKLSSSFLFSRKPDPRPPFTTGFDGHPRLRLIS